MDAIIIVASRINCRHKKSPLRKENEEFTLSFSAQTHLTHFSAVNLSATILNAPHFIDTKLQLLFLYLW
jgi:hypothetical protein